MKALFYYTIAYVILRYLSQIYRETMPVLTVLVSREDVLGEHIYDFGTKKHTVKLNFAKMQSVKEVVDVCFHEFRHIWQQSHVDPHVLAFWRRFATINNTTYWYAAHEIDARAFAASKEWSLGLKVFSSLQECLQARGYREALLCCRMVAHKYGVAR